MRHGWKAKTQIFLGVLLLSMTPWKKARQPNRHLDQLFRRVLKMTSPPKKLLIDTFDAHEPRGGDGGGVEGSVAEQASLQATTRDRAQIYAGSQI